MKVHKIQISGSIDKVLFEQSNTHSSRIPYSCFRTIPVESSHSDKDGVAHEAKDVHYLVIYKRSSQEKVLRDSDHEHVQDIVSFSDSALRPLFWTQT